MSAEELRADFLNLNLIFSPEILAALKGIPHHLQDLFGNTISARQAESLPPENSRDLNNRGKPVAKIRIDPAQANIVCAFLEAQIETSLAAHRLHDQMESRELLANDLDQILELSERENFTFENLLRHYLKILRSHVWVEKASVFGIYDGFTLEGLAGIGGQDQQNWKMNFSTVAGATATSRKPYHTENPAADPNFQVKEGVAAPRNLLCYPLLHGSTLVGVMNLSNRVGGKFTEQDFQVVDRFANVAAHILQKHYFKKRMQSFERTSDHLGKYLSSKVVKNVKNLDQLELGGAEKKVVCLFSDIRGYTSITEGIDAAQLVKLLNFHFEKMHAIIERFEGTLDKIVGDLIMAVWNIPHDQPEPELLAMKTAIEMQKEMIRVVAPEWLRNGVEKVGMGIGVNAGTAVAGNLGSSRFMNYTVIGDAINTAQRLEAKAKAGEIWMEESIFPQVAGKIPKPERKECDIRLKGKDKTINAFVYRPLNY